MVQEATFHPGQDDEHLTDHPEFEQFKATVPHNMTTVPLNITQPEEGKATMNIGHSVLDVLRLAQELGVPMNEALKALENQRRSEHLFNQMVYSPGEQQLPEDMKPTFAGTKFNKPDEGIFHQGNPMDMSWRLLKNLGDDDPAFAEHRRLMEQMKQQEEQIREQAQATAPKMTPQIQSYQQQLDAKQAKLKEEQQIRALERQGRRVGDYRKALIEFYNKHGHYPKKTKKNVIKIVNRLRERVDK